MKVSAVLPFSGTRFAVPILLCCAGYALCIAAFYPGILSPDSLSMYDQAKAFSFMDWYSPVLALIWAPLQLVFPGPQGMLFLLLALYWGAFLVFADAAAAIDPRGAVLLPLLGLMPFTVNFAGTIWTDVLLGVSWLMCTALIFHTQVRGSRMSVAMQIVAWSLFICGALARPNALFAAVPLGLYLLKPEKAHAPVIRAVLAAAIVAGIWSAGQALFYEVLHARRTHPIDSILAFDLAGISHFSNKNYFPLQWNNDQTSKILSCYNPKEWDSYNPKGECGFVFRRMENSGLWGSPDMWRFWLATVRAEPVAYLHHRAAHFLTFTLGAAEYPFHQGNSRAEALLRLQANFVFRAVRNYAFAAGRLGICRPVFWLVLGFLCVLGAPLCSAPSRRLIGALGLSAITYLGTYFFVGVASDFRYAYWSILASSVAAFLLACELIGRVRYRPASQLPS